MNKIEFENFITSHSREELLSYQNEFGRDALREYYNLSYGNLKELINIMDLHISKEDANKKRKSTWAKKETSVENKLIKVCELISKAEFQEYYISQNHSIEETREHFKITQNDILRLIKEYDCYKPKTLSHEIAKQTWINTLGVDNPSRSSEVRAKTIQTCNKLYGHDNTFQVPELMAGVKELKESHYGVGKCNNPDKNQETRKRNFGSVEESYRVGHQHCVETWIEKYGYDNVSKVPEIKERILQSTRNYHGAESRPNREFKENLISSGLYISDEENKEFILGTYVFDFKVGDNLIEIDPYATHNSCWSPFDKESLGLDKKYHYNKSRMAEENGYRCIHVFDWDDTNKIINLLKPRQRVYARQCEVREVDIETAKDYIDTYHLQRYSKDLIRIGLFFDGELVSIMTFGTPRYNKKFEYELIRYCSHYQVVGGAEKIFQYFLTTYLPKSIISYCDTSKFSGNIYTRLGFGKKDINIGKHWYNPITKQHITDNLLRQRGYDQLFGTSYGKGTSNEELMLLSGFIYIFDAGQGYICI